MSVAQNFVRFKAEICSEITPDPSSRAAKAIPDTILGSNYTAADSVWK